MRGRFQDGAAWARWGAGQGEGHALVREESGFPPPGPVWEATRKLPSHNKPSREH